MISNDLHGELLTALNRGAPREALFAIVLQHKERGVMQRMTYDTLQSIWTELGCHEDEDNKVCETLEDIMDRVWGFCPARDAIWESSLSEIPGE
jgi:hypothetical protein